MEQKKTRFKLMRDFKDFALKGNMFDMAIGVIIGTVFKDFVTSFTYNIIMPVISVFTGNIDFSGWRIRLPSLFGEKVDPVTGEVVDNFLKFGDFLSAVISFFILAFVVFMMARIIGRLREISRRNEEKVVPAPAPLPTREELLLTEIRDLLKEKMN